MLGHIIDESLFKLNYFKSGIFKSLEVLPKVDYNIYIKMARFRDSTKYSKRNYETTPPLLFSVVPSNGQPSDVYR